MLHLLTNSLHSAIALPVDATSLAVVLHLVMSLGSMAKGYQEQAATSAFAALSLVALMGTYVLG